jgi:hypothetical protein
MSHKKNPLEKLVCYLQHQKTWGFILIGFGIGMILVIFLPINVWLFALAIGALVYGIYCLIN